VLIAVAWPRLLIGSMTLIMSVVLGVRRFGGGGGLSSLYRFYTSLLDSEPYYPAAKVAPTPLKRRFFFRSC